MLINTNLLSTFTNCKKGLFTSSCLSACSSTWNNSVPTGQIFKKFDMSNFWESVEKIHITDKNNGTLHRSVCTFMIIYQKLFLEQERFQTKVVEKTKMHILCPKTSFWKSCHLWDKMEKWCTDRQAKNDNIIHWMLFACWIIKVTDTHTISIHNTCYFSMATMVMQKHLNVMLHIHCLSC